MLLVGDVYNPPSSPFFLVVRAIWHYRFTLFGTTQGMTILHSVSLESNFYNKIHATHTLLEKIGKDSKASVTLQNTPSVQWM